MVNLNHIIIIGIIKKYPKTILKFEIMRVINIIKKEKGNNFALIFENLKLLRL